MNLKQLLHVSDWPCTFYHYIGDQFKKERRSIQCACKVLSIVNGLVVQIGHCFAILNVRNCRDAF